MKADTCHTITIPSTEFTDPITAVNFLLRDIPKLEYKDVAVITIGEGKLRGVRIFQLPSWISNELQLSSLRYTLALKSEFQVRLIIDYLASFGNIKTIIIVRCYVSKWILKTYIVSQNYNNSVIMRTSGLEEIGYYFGKNYLTKDKVLKTQVISDENQSIIWPEREGFPLIPQFSDFQDLISKLKSTLEKVVDKKGKGLLLFSYNGSGSASDFDTIPSLKYLGIELPDNIQVIEFEASCYGSIYAIHWLKYLVAIGEIDFGAYVCVSDRARHFSKNTPLFSINYSDAVGYAIISTEPSYSISEPVSIIETSLIENDFPKVIGNRNSLLLKNRFRQLEWVFGSDIIKGYGLDYSSKQRCIVLPRMSPNSFAQLYSETGISDKNLITHEDWPTGIFSGLNWIVDLADSFGNTNQNEIIVSTLGYGFIWASCKLTKIDN
ncbi:hypothetical protein ACSLVK_00145 [Photorhabdus tasmaniensis]|uniref:hypothetical protein n=1 Tax=Photorhabdus tasmaniensis TaxID=1004159 RepID=UPI004043618E